MQDTIESVLNFLHVIEKLKYECRHGWTSTGRQESVADHCWRLAVMLIVCAPHIEKEIDLLKALKMALLHDIGEVKIGDQHYFDILLAGKKEERSKLELKAVEELALLLNGKGEEIVELCKEFEEGRSKEAQIVYFLDKLEACLQHNEADPSTWTQQEKDNIENHYDSLDVGDPFLSRLKERVRIETRMHLQ